MFLTSVVIGLATRKSAERFERASRDVVGSQLDLLMHLVTKNADTEYGRRHGFASIRSLDDWRRRVPVVSYDDLQADMRRVTEGAERVFTAEKPVMFAQTSGTSGDPKFIPVTSTCQGRAHQDVMRTWLHHAQQDHPDLFSRKIVSLVSPAVEGYTPSGVPFGSTSGHMYKNQNVLIRCAYPVPYSAFEIQDYEAKYYAIMRAGVAHDVRMLATANPSSILKLVEKADEHSEDIVRDVRDGTLAGGFAIEPPIRAAIESRLKPDPAGARALERARGRRRGRLLPGDYWPRLSMIGCWKGGTVGHYLERFGDWFDPDGARPVPVRDWGYLASEMRGSIPLADEGSHGALTIATNFFEFVEVDNLEYQEDDPSAWRFLTAADLLPGHEYYVFVTTTGGLYRYDINDVVRVEGHYHQTPQVVFVRKGRGMTNITGEKVSVNQVILSVQRACREAGVSTDHFKAEADQEESRYLFRVEFLGVPDAATSAAFLSAVDRNLKQINIEYKAKRDSLRLNAPVLHVMREGWYERHRQAQAAAGKRVFQFKTEVLAPQVARPKDLGSDLDRIVDMAD